MQARSRNTPVPIPRTKHADQSPQRFPSHYSDTPAHWLRMASGAVKLAKTGSESSRLVSFQFQRAVSPATSSSAKMGDQTASHPEHGHAEGLSPFGPHLDCHQNSRPKGPGRFCPGRTGEEPSPEVLLMVHDKLPRVCRSGRWGGKNDIFDISVLVPQQTRNQPVNLGLVTLHQLTVGLRISLSGPPDPVSFLIRNGHNG